MKRKWKIILYTLLGFFILLGGAGAYAYQQLKPKNHFKTVPVVTSGGPSNEQKKEATPEKAQNNAFNILLMGSDQRKGEKVGHSDSMILLHVDLNKHEYRALSIPRDTRVRLDGYGYTKLTSVQYIVQANKGMQEGVEAAVKAVGELTGAPINYYVQTNYTGLQSMVESIGGIDMKVPFDVKLTHPWYPENKNKVITAGIQSLDGKMVTEVVHERYSLKNGEFDRQRLQEEALIAIAKKLSSPANITKLPDFMKTLPDFLIASNMSTADMLSLGLAVKEFNPETQLQYFQVGGESKSMYDDILKANNSQLVMDKDQLQAIIEQHFK